MPRLEFSLLGPLAANCDGNPIALGGQKRRALLAVLLLEPNGVVSRDRLIDALWGEDPPETARNTLQVYVSQLRKLLPEDTLETAPPGYRLGIAPDTVDPLEFVRLGAEDAGRRARAGAERLTPAARAGDPCPRSGTEPPAGRPEVAAAGADSADSAPRP